MHVHDYVLLNQMVERTKHVMGVDANQGGSLVDGNQRYNQNIVHQDTIHQLCLMNLDGMVQFYMNARMDSTLQEKCLPIKII